MKYTHSNSPIMIATSPVVRMIQHELIVEVTCQGSQLIWGNYSTHSHLYFFPNLIFSLYFCL